MSDISHNDDQAISKDLTNDRASDYPPLCDAVSYTPSPWAIAQETDAPYLRKLSLEARERIVKQRAQAKTL